MTLLEYLDRRNVSLLAQLLVSFTVALAFLGSLAALLVFAWYGREFPPGLKEVLLVLIGATCREFGGMCAFWLGSTTGSDRKTDLLAGRVVNP